jgi:hypothetical protein
VSITPIVITKTAVGMVKKETTEMIGFDSSFLRPLAYQTRKVAMAIKTIETKK